MQESAFWQYMITLVLVGMLMVFRVSHPSVLQMYNQHPASLPGSHTDVCV